MRTALITIAAQRISHLRNQIEAVTLSDRSPDDYIVVAMNDPDVLDTVRDGPARGISMPARAPLPLAAARNLGARTALRHHAELLIFLDVDCMPDHRTIARYHEVCAGDPDADTLLCGPVTYLPPPPDPGYDLRALPRLRDPHPARPAPADDQVLTGADPNLFWSLSFAVTARTWCRTGGFDTRYRGYGAEDTDFAYRAAQAGIDIRWIGGAHSYHQHHPVSNPPTEHLSDILTNARIFFSRWGRWPMRGWLDEFTRLGLLEHVGGTRGWTPVNTR
ncbi:glycosyltransferase family 2 protein [Nocardia yamanashiensis]|uniref:glycosyltransferase family 2 protein n=1 Tax=Nocardia yamanashiensis TaxID=209247 RepID=UPI001E2D4F3F|nr:galactosyltransferase-related protein [Nocardia yamanashiensis]UGT43854.1 glycosyltransferase family 2 protein [Nocardia yamanashiensis]